MSQSLGVGDLRRVAGDATSTSLGLVGATSGVVQISLYEPTVEVERLQ
jgi:hypothetical protein